MTDIHSYDDIIDLPRPDPKRHQRMPVQDRAAQFMPFAALTGYNDVIAEVSRTTDEKIILDPREKEAISRKLNELERRIDEMPHVRITFFRRDRKKAGGEYITISAKIEKIDVIGRSLSLQDGQKIFFTDILRIE